jgi:hypothetical protein
MLSPSAMITQIRHWLIVDNGSQSPNSFCTESTESGSQYL